MSERAVFSIVLSILIIVIFMHLIVFNVLPYQIFLVGYLLCISSFSSCHLDTTMNVLRFPIQIGTGKNQLMREECEENEVIFEENSHFIENETTVVGEFLY